MSTTPSIGLPITKSRRRFIGWTVIGLVSCVALGASYWLTLPPVDNSREIDLVRRFEGGTLVIAGGGPLPLEIRLRFLDFAGGPSRARLVVIPSFDLQPQQAASLLKTWHDLGVKTVQILHATSRDEANHAAFLQPIKDATGVWLSGGSQDWLSQHYVGTLVEDNLQAVIKRGGVVGGTSAGAAAMTKVMIEQGLEFAIEGVGFDLLRDAVIDQHFLKRSRLNRLMWLMETHPDRIAFGIDEGTALVVQVPFGRIGVIGSSYVITYIPKTNTAERRFESLRQGDQIDLEGLKSGRTRVSSRSDLDAALSDE